jgi:hypothetical protein
MGYIKLGHEGRFKIVISGEIVIFAILTIILLTITLGAWAIFERKPQEELLIQRAISA